MVATCSNIGVLACSRAELAESVGRECSDFFVMVFVSHLAPRPYSLYTANTAETYMATFDNMDLGDGDVAISSGAAFQLKSVSPISWRHETADGSLILEQGARVVIYHVKAPFSNIESLLELAHARVQEGLDVLGMMKSHFLFMPKAHLEHILWFRDELGTQLRVQDSVASNIRSEVSWEKIDGKTGQVVARSSDHPAPEWHDSFRYFRYSQIGNDLYACYRLAFLSVESLLSGYCPRLKGEKEKDWHLRANRNLEEAGLQFAPFAQSVGHDAVAAFVDEQYVAQRCAHFHAKAGSPRFIPGELAERKIVADALERLGRYIQSAAVLVHATGNGVSLMTLQGMAMMVGNLVPDLFLAVSDDSTEAKAEDTLISPAGMSVTDLPTTFQGISDGIGYEFAFSGQIEVQRMSSPVVRTLAGVIRNVCLYARGNLPTLELVGIDILSTGKFTLSQVEQVCRVHLMSSLY